MIAVLGGCGADPEPEGGADTGSDTTGATSTGTSPSTSSSSTSSTDADTDADTDTDTDADSDADTDADTDTDTDAGTDTDTDSGSGSGSGSGSESSTGADVEPGFDIIDISRATDLTPDGSIALLEDGFSPTLDAYFYDTMTGEQTFATSVGDPLSNFATGISADLRISALHDYPVQASLWTDAGGWLDLGTVYPSGCNDIAGAWDISADGSVAVGMVWNGCSPAAFRWVDDGDAGTMTALDVIGSSWQGPEVPATNRATVVSDDGMVIAGFASNGGIDRAAAIWNADGSGFLLDADEEWPSEVLSISPDGQMVAGTRGYDGFYWTEEEGMTSLGKLPEAEAVTTTYPNAIAADGELVAGAFGDPWMTLPVAFVWTRADGMRALHELIEANDLDIPEGVELTNVTAASTDGSVLLGTAYDAEGNSVSFVLRMSASAYGL